LGNLLLIILKLVFQNTLNETASAASIFGFAGNDTLNGQGGNDNLDGGTGNDTINGGAGNENLRGGDGSDTLLGWSGVVGEKDNISGDAGSDVFILATGTTVFSDDGNIGNAGTNDYGYITDFNTSEDFIRPQPRD
jgi:Ca2+-binding RTX toxin-like protein